MKPQIIKEKEIMKSPNFAAIIAIVAEMARCVNKNIARVHVGPLDAQLTEVGGVDLANLIGVNLRS